MFTWDPAKDMWCNRLSCEDPPWIFSHWFPTGLELFRASKPEQTARRSSDYSILIPPHDTQLLWKRVWGTGKGALYAFWMLRRPFFNDAFCSSSILEELPYAYSHSSFFIWKLFEYWHWNPYLPIAGNS